MRIESTVVAVSWIPSEAVKGVMKAPVRAGHGPLRRAAARRRSGDLEAGGPRDRFRFANELRAWIEVDDDGAIVGHGYAGGGVIGSTTLGLGPGQATFEAVAYPDLQARARGGRRLGAASSRPPAAAPASRRPGASTARRSCSTTPPLAWTTLVAHPPRRRPADCELVGASPFPRHWVYGPDGDAAAKSGLIDFKDWYRHAFGEAHARGATRTRRRSSPRSRRRSSGSCRATIMRRGQAEDPQAQGGRRRSIEQGEEGDALFLLLDGVLRVEVDGEPVAELGPGALLGERAVLEGGRRTATLVAVTPCKVAVARQRRARPAAQLAEVSAGPPPRRTHGAARLRVHVLGVRGSTPAPGREFARVGGNTSCVALAHDGEPPSLVLDAGTGLRGLGALLGGAPFRGAILLGHLHWDHTQGLPFFAAGRPRPAPRCASACPTRRTATRRRRARAGRCRRRTSRSAPRSCGAGGRFEGLEPGLPPARRASRCWPSRSRTRAGAPSASGSPTGAAPIAYLSDHEPVRARARARRLGPVPRGRPGPGRRGRRARPRRPAHRGGAAGRRPLRPLGRRLRRAGSASAAGAAQRAALPPRPEPHRRRGRRPRRRLRRPARAVLAAAEGAVIDL